MSGSLVHQTPQATARALERELNRYRAVFDNAGAGTIISEADMTISLANDEFSRMSGYARGDIEGKMPWTRIVAFPEDREKMIRYHRTRRIAPEHAPRDYEFTLKDSGGGHKQIIARVAMIPGTDKSVGSFIDVSPILRAREALLHRENKKLRRALGKGTRFCGIVGKSPAMAEVYELILRAAAADVNVIIYGESGTGKELAAKAIHTMSDRSDKPFIPVHCGAIPPNLMESEFFGVRQGAFTGALKNRPGLLDLAHHGTLFLDELGEMDLNFQVKLLRVLEGAGYMPVGGRQVKIPDIRIVAATNRNLNQLVKAGKMREDFFYRIHILPLYLPPLRERKEDIPLLVSHFLEKYQAGITALPGHLMASLQAHDWPGNVRELENTLQRYISLDNLDILGSGTPAASQALPSPGRGDASLKTALNRFEKAYITNILNQNQWNRKTTAEALSIGRKTLYMKMRNLGINRPGQT
ncbi:MAG: sigma 54-interacting transcriptional regulator [Desulfobacter sp.]|nr:MAG: sigma 54-interacting transcriptional regulator [Desulfobacter sp.]